MLFPLDSIDSKPWEPSCQMYLSAARSWLCRVEFLFWKCDVVPNDTSTRAAWCVLRGAWRCIRVRLGDQFVWSYSVVCWDEGTGGG
jgi:hypothetical protein